MASLQHELVKRVLVARKRNPDPSDVEAIRKALTAQNRGSVVHPPRSVRRGRRVSIDNGRGFPVFHLVRQPSDRTLFYVPGGSFKAPPHPRQWKFAARIADDIDAELVFPAYPLSPEHTVGDSFESMVSLLSEAMATSPDGVVLAGDSAGGGYALALAEALRDRGGLQPTHLVLLAPWVDLTGPDAATMLAAEDDPWLSIAHLPIYAQFWAGDVPLEDPRVSPGLGDLAGLPPALMFCGDRDLLKPGCDELFERADRAGWDLEYVEAPGMLHVYPLLPVPEARDAEQHILRFLAS